MRIAAALLALLIAAPVAAQRPVERVDPFIGTDGTGHTFPGPTMPFGMVQPGPDNAASGWAYTSGYQYRAPTILGFSQTRASGTGIPELGDLLLMPSGERREDLASRYAKKSEIARPGYYAVTLVDNGVRVELTAGLRTALHRYTFDRGGRVWVMVDTQHGLTFRTDRRPVLDSRTATTRYGLEGVQHRTNWTTRTVAFSLAFDRPIAAAVELPRRPGDKAARYLLGFDLGQGRVLQAKAGLSTVDVEGARRNRDAEPGFRFDVVAAAASDAWEAMLSRISIDAPARQQRIFYTALYHALLHPSVVSDVDGRWRGPDGTVRRVAHGLRYSTMSLWDSFRAAHPLYTLIVPERVDDFVATLLDHADAAGRLPMWPIWGGETGTMIGEPALPVIADAWAKGFRGFDGKRALAAMHRTATTRSSLFRPDLIDRYGYYPTDLVDGEAVSRALEAGVADDALARMARMLGDNAAAARFGRRAQGWQRTLDPETGLARGRDSAGRRRTPFDPLKPTSPLNNPGDYTEANAWQYGWTPALHDPAGLVAAMGGRGAFADQLDRFFFDLKPTAGAEYLGQEAMIGQYAHGNEPSHHVAWLYAYTDRPGTGQDLVRDIARHFYGDGPDGIVGNEDAGQMSAWLIFATLGLYPVQPASGSYVLGRPLVSRAKVSVGGKTLTIERGGLGPNDHAGGAMLNGQRYRLTIPHRMLARGGTLRSIAERPARQHDQPPTTRVRR